MKYDSEHESGTANPFYSLKKVVTFTTPDVLFPLGSVQTTPEYTNCIFYPKYIKQKPITHSKIIPCVYFHTRFLVNFRHKKDAMLK